MMNKTLLALAIPAALLALQGCSTGPSSAEYDEMTRQVVQTSFAERGIAKMDRLAPDMANDLCSQADVAGKPLSDELAKKIEEAEMKTIRWPSDGKYLGDWKQGERIAQSGRGLTWSDQAGAENGGNCYNCHQISKEEISFGNLGPSLYQYGKLRGVTDPNSEAAKPIVQYTWGKLWNSRAYTACSQMPRAGHKGILTETQIQHIMALLLDPASPVNK
jgi:L-cysteine S-thiosulfotransferase